MNVVQIRVKEDWKSDYYSSIVNQEWKKFGVTPTPHWGTTPETIPNGPLRFAEHKFSGTKWTDFEIAIWYSHYRVWQQVREPTYVIEHDTYPLRPLPKFDKDWGMFSLFPANDDAWLGRGQNISPGSGYYINITSASILMDMATCTEITENVDGHIFTTMKRFMGLKEKELQEKFLKTASCFQIVNYNIGTTASHNHEETNLSSSGGQEE